MKKAKFRYFLAGLGTIPTRSGIGINQFKRHLLLISEAAAKIGHHITEKDLNDNFNRIMEDVKDII